MPSRTVNYTLRLQPELKREVDRAAEEMNLEPSEFARLALRLACRLVETRAVLAEWLCQTEERLSAELTETTRTAVRDEFAQLGGSSSET